MAIKIKEEVIETSAERLICTGLIVSDSVIKQIAPILEAKLMSARYTQYLVNWCLDYYKKFNAAPRKHIQNIFESQKRDTLDPDIADLIESLLIDLNDQLMDNSVSFNEQYVIEQAEQFIKSKKALMLCEDVTALLSSGRILEAEGMLANYNIPRRPDAEADDVFNMDFWSEEEEEQQTLFRLPGELNRLVGPIERDSFISILAPEKRGKCLSFDSLVQLADGQLKCIEDVVKDKDQDVLSYDEEAKCFVNAKIVDWWDNGVKPCVQVYFKSGRKSKVTLKHPFLTPSGWEKIKYLKIGDQVALPRKITIKKGYSQPHEIMRLLAYTLTTKYFTKGSLRYFMDDLDVVFDFKKCVAYMQDSIYNREGDSEFYILSNPDTKEHNICKLLQQCALWNRKADKLFIPNLVLMADDKSCIEFLRALYTSQGQIEANKISIVLKNETLIWQLQSLLLRFGIIGSIITLKSKCYLIIEDFNSLSIFKNKIGMFGDKVTILNKYGRTWTKQAKLEADTVQDIFWDEIVKIEDIGEVHTYDLSVEKHHNFIADNCLVHNTWWLLYFAILAYRQRCNVVFYSIGDMTKPQVKRRLRHMLTTKDPKRKRGIVKKPVLDCYHNQFGNCPLGEDTDPILLGGKGKIRELGSFNDFPDHVPCVECFKNKGDRRHFIGRPWWESCEIEAKPIDKACKALLQQSGNSKFKLATFPPASVSVNSLESHLDILQQQDGFIPDVVIIDYADLLEPEPGDRKLDYRNQINSAWMKLRGLSQKRSCSVITATQAKIETRRKSQVDQWDTSEDKRKLAHVTAMLALNQTPEEKRKGIMRISNIAMRDDDFDTELNVAVLQCLQLGKPYLISYPYKDDPILKREKKVGKNE